jgi:hypothetical protein
MSRSFVSQVGSLTMGCVLVVDATYKRSLFIRHIGHRFHFVRHATHDGSINLFKVEGVANPSNSMTKILTAELLIQEARVY